MLFFLLHDADKITLSFGYNAPHIIEDMIRRDDTWKVDVDPRINYLRVVSKVFIDRGEVEERNFVSRHAHVDVWDIRRGGWRLGMTPRSFCELVISRVNEVLSPNNCDETHDDSMTEYVRCLENDDALIGALVPSVASLFGIA